MKEKPKNKNDSEIETVKYSVLIDQKGQNKS